MASQLEFIDIFTETEDSVRARIETDADPTIDKRVGEIFYDLTTPLIKEIVRQWDSMNSMISVGFLPWSYGSFLDYKGSYEMGINRKEATIATGVVTFVGTQFLTIPSGTSIATSTTDPNVEIFRYGTTVADQIGMQNPTVAISAVAGAAGNVAHTVAYQVTFVGRGGETGPNTATAAITPVSKIVNLTNIPLGPSGTTSRKIYRQDAGAGTFKLLATIVDNVTTIYNDNDNATLATAAVSAVNTTNAVNIAVAGADVGLNYNAAIGALSVLVDPITGVTSVTNALAISGGSDRETDTEYASRLLEAVQSPTGQGNKGDYKQWAQSVLGVTNATVIPLASGNNTVTIVLTGPNNSAVTAAKVAEVQALIDPNINGDGSGLGPIGAVVTIATVTNLSVTLSATIVHETGYTLDGTSSTSATRQVITDAVTKYFRSVAPGATVRWTEVVAAIIYSLGVADASSVLINGVTTNIVLTSTQVANLTTVTLT